MADADFTASELEEKFPINADPFSVWLNPDATSRCYAWAVNDEDGNPIAEVSSYETASRIANSLKAAECAKPYAAIDKIDAAHVALVRAQSVIDMVYMLSNGESRLESLMQGSLENSLDAALQHLREVDEFFGIVSVKKVEVGHV